MANWDESREKMFKENRVDARKIFHRVGKASNYLDCGIKNFVQEILLDNKANNLRVGFGVGFA